MNHGSGGKPGKARRQMTPDEAELWRQLTHSLDKVKTKPRVTPHTEIAVQPAPAIEPAARVRGASSSPRIPAPAALPPPPQTPLPAEFDRRTLRQVGAGKMSIDARLDLHGLHQDTAHARLRAFLVNSQAKGHRMVLVITGKGAGRPAEGPQAPPRGVLRRSVPLWLEEPELRAIVLSYAAAGVRHGGDGALYIRLRKARAG
jgi:DNA-nicking Smr family endonuclease